MAWIILLNVFMPLKMLAPASYMQMKSTFIGLALKPCTVIDHRGSIKGLKYNNIKFIGKVMD